MEFTVKNPNAIRSLLNGFQLSLHENGLNMTFNIDNSAKTIKCLVTSNVDLSYHVLFLFYRNGKSDLCCSNGTGDIIGAHCVHSWILKINEVVEDCNEIYIAIKKNN